MFTASGLLVVRDGSRWTTLGLAGMLAACTPAPAVTPPTAGVVASPSTTATYEEARAALRRGELERAASAFAALSPSSPERAAVGRIALALTTDDHDALRAELDGRASTPGRELALLLADAALRVDAPDAVREPLRAAVCDHKEELGAPLVTEAGQLCAHLTARAATPVRHRCSAGCDTTHSLPLSLVGHLPVVLVSVNGTPPAPFIVDTGASMALLTREHAERVGVVPVEGTSMEVGAAGGHQVTTEIANVSFTLGGVRVDGAEAVLLDLPLAGMGGIISPQTTLANHRVTLDVVAFELGLEPAGQDLAPAMVRWPLWLHDTRPALMGSVAGRPPRPLLLDTGASGSFLTEMLDALGPPLPRVDATHGYGAGQTKARNWTTKELVPFEVVGLQWTIDGPSIAHREPPSELPALEIMGTIGMDFVMGRRLVVSRPERALWVSPRAQLAPWSTGDVAHFDVQVGDAPPFALIERVVGRTADTVTLEATITSPTAPAHVRFDMNDTWSSRGSWLVSRKAVALWDILPTGAVAAPPNTLPERYRSAMVAFETTGAPTITAVTMDKAGDTVFCTELAIPAKTKPTGASNASPRETTFRLVECPVEPWRAVLLELTAGNETLWRVRRKDITHRP